MYAELPCHGKAHLMQPKAEHVQDKKEKLAAALNWLPCNPFATVRCRFALPVWSWWKPTTTMCTNESFQKSTSIAVESNAICFYFLPPTAMYVAALSPKVSFLTRKRSSSVSFQQPTPAFTMKPTIARRIQISITLHLSAWKAQITRQSHNGPRPI